MITIPSTITVTISLDSEEYTLNCQPWYGHSKFPCQFVKTTNEAVQQAVAPIGTVPPPKLGLTVEHVRDQ